MRKDQCLFCKSRACYYRIFTWDGSYDEVSCRIHQLRLEQHFYAKFKSSNPGKYNMVMSGTKLFRFINQVLGTPFEGKRN